MNRSITKHNTSGHKNIYFNKRDNVWRFIITINEKCISKRFKGKQDAINGRDKFYVNHPNILFGN